MLNVILRPYISALLGIGCLALGILSFGDANLFDRIFLFVAVITAIALRKNTDVLGVICILVLGRLFEEFIWSFDFHNPIIKTFAYSFAILCIWRLWYDVCSKVLLLTIALGLSSELYWYLSGYTKTPIIYWHVFLMSLYLVVKHLIFFRTAITQRFIAPAKSTVLDYKMMNIATWFVVLDAIIVVDYIVRHTFWPVEYPIIYYAYPYIAQAIASYMLWLLFEENHYFLAERIYKA